MAERHGIDAEELLAHSAWLRALALRLARDPDDADDLVQETYITSLRRAPDEREKVRPWLSKILLNTFRMRLRSDTRRTAREEASHVDERHAPASDTLVARAELQRKLVDLVLQLAEPYRSTVLLHFCEGISLADIARTQDVPAGTVRWRLKFALDQMRSALDADTGGRKQWAVPLLAFSKGLLVAQKTTKLFTVALVLLLLLVVGVVVLHGRHDKNATSASGTAGAHSSSTAGAHGGDPDSVNGGVGAAPIAWLVQAGVKPRRIAGRVTFGGAVVANATVELASMATEAGIGTAARRTTNATGQFDFGLQAAMEWNVRASAPGKASTALDVDLRDPTARPAPDHLELSLGTCGAAIFGTVRDASGGPIAGARLSRWPDGPTYVPGGPSVVTDDKGTYEMCVEARWPGWIMVDVSAEGYGAITFSGIVPGRMKLDFALVPEATIVGHVIDGDTNQPVPNAYVVVPKGPRGTETTAGHATFTDASGHFKVDRIAPGPHFVFARGNGYVPSPRGVVVNVEAGQTSNEIEIKLAKGATMRGIVQMDGKRVAGAQVSFVSENAGGPRTVAVSQADGSFVLAAVPTGPVRFTAMPYEVVTPKSFQVEKSDYDGIVIDVEQLGSIIGHVVRDQKPVAGGKVDIQGPNARDVAPIVADADGRFEVHGLRPGPWTLFADSDASGAFGKAPNTVNVELGKTAEITIDLAYAGSISGTVVDQAGTPVPGVAVLFKHTSTDDAGWAVTSTDGTFRAAKMTGGGQYRPAVLLRPFSTVALKPAAGGEFPLIAVADGTSSVTGVTLAVRIDHLSIAGKVVDSAGGPVPDVRIVAELLEGATPPSFFSGLQDPATTTDVDGRFSIDDLLDGTYALRAQSAAGGEALQLGIRAGTKNISILLSQPGSIDGTLAGFTGRPLVTALRDDGGKVAPANVTGTTFTIAAVTAGTYLIEARTDTEAASAAVTVKAGETTHLTLTSKGSGVVAGHVVDFRTHKPIQGMTCRALPRIGTTSAAIGSPGGMPTDAQGTFTITAAPAGDIAVRCDGLWRIYSDGLRLTTLQQGQRVDVEVPVVAWADELAHTIANMGADFADGALTPTLAHVKAGGPAATAGLANGDVIITVDGQSIAELSVIGVEILILNRAPGSKVKIGALRAGKPVGGDVVLGSEHG